jgi:diadenosine tetraphosphate (Ap4A) HIT family hydrolase
MSKTTQYVDLSKARVAEQLKVMEDIKQKGICPFCINEIDEFHKAKMIRKGKHWLITYNQWPYKHTQMHLLAIATYHAEKLSDLKKGALDELQEHIIWLEKELNIKTGAVCMRFGDITQNGATVNHIHVHLIVPVKHTDKTVVDKKVRFKIW